MKKLATLKVAPLAAATFLSFAVAAPVSATAIDQNHHMHPEHGAMTMYPVGMMGMSLSDMLLSMHGVVMPAMPMMHGSQPEVMHAQTSTSRGVVDDFAATITVVHTEVAVSTTQSSTPMHEPVVQHHEVMSAVHHEPEQKHETDKKHDWSADNAYNHASDKKGWGTDWDHKDHEDKHDKKAMHASDWSYKEDEDCWKEEDAEQAHWQHRSEDEWSKSDHDYSSDKHHDQHAVAYAHESENKEDCPPVDECPPVEDCPPAQDDCL
jgi:hypothetical protein